jgi:hypothetical protein
MSVFGRIAHYAADYRARRRRMRTYLQLISLPEDIQKDIGWVDAFVDADEEVRKLRHRQ